MTFAHLPAHHVVSTKAVPALAKTTPITSNFPAGHAAQQPQNSIQSTNSDIHVSEPQEKRQAWEEVAIDPDRLNTRKDIEPLALALPPHSASHLSPLASIVARIGGLTLVLLVMDMMILIVLVKIMGQGSAGVILALKAHCMSGQLVWYWISSSPEIREATDAKLSHAFSRILPEAYFNPVTTPVPSLAAGVSDAQMHAAKSQSNQKNSSLHIILH
jgi:hypothetical protein